jgi:type II secretory pathway component GspD/PulD (secretin)
MSASSRARLSAQAVALSLVAIRFLAASSAQAAEPWPAASPRPRPQEAKILEALEKPAVLQFVDTPLRDVVAFLADAHGVPIVLDTSALERVGIGSDCPITLDLKSVSLRSGLELLLAPLDLTCVIRNEVLMITTPEEAAARPEVRVYDVRKLLGGKEDAAPIAELARAALCDAPPPPPAGARSLPPRRPPGGSQGLKGKSEASRSAEKRSAGGKAPAEGGRRQERRPEPPRQPAAKADPRILAYRHLLIVRGTQQEHRRLAELLAALDAGLQK